MLVWKGAKMLKKIVLFMAIGLLLVGAMTIIAQERGRGRDTDTSSLLKQMPLPKTEAEKRIVGVLNELDKFRGEMQNVPVEDGKLLRVLVETTGAQHVAEIGTSNGYSGLWICLGLLNTGGKLTTFDIDPDRIALAKENFKKAGVDQLVTIILGDAHKEIINLKSPIDMVFIDADKPGYPDYLNKLLPIIRPGGLILAHNVGMLSSEYIKAITTNPELETIFLNMQGTGVGVTLKKR
jgi:caffeoyl-CoA O-methyltransferase